MLVPGKKKKTNHDELVIVFYNVLTLLLRTIRIKILRKFTLTSYRWITSFKQNMYHCDEFKASQNSW